MSPPAMKKISLDPAAIAALEADGGTKLVKPLSQKALVIIQRVVAREVFGPTMKPKFKQQLLTFVSFAAIKSSWAADHWQRRQRMRA